jgi:lactoylglutathione lyase
MACKCVNCGGKITGLAHIGIFVKSIEQSNAFYADKLGFEITGSHKMGDTTLEFLRIGSCILELIEKPDYQPRSAGVIDHIAVEVEEIEPLVCKLIEKQIPFLTGEINDAKDLLGGVRNIFFTGPDGERIEFFEYTAKG